jgi:alkanesulfonate monooxygenase SsuD/methylene tetrahydromethanopterin reductase-like flavin-dependent oxidoreductase (luciferase family)
MKFGLFGGARLGPANPLGDSYNYRDFISYVRDAEELGFASIFLVEHHFTGGGQISASLNLLSYLAACTTRMRLGTAVVVLPWHNPVLLAEQVATLDVLSGGRVDFGIGRGYRKIEFEQFCIPMEEAQERHNECLEVMLKAWNTPGRFSHHGKRWQFKDIVVEPAPVQQPHPPLWMAAGTPGGISYVASSNYNLLLDQLAAVDEAAERVRIYLDGLAARGLPRDAARVGVTRALHIITTESERAKAMERRREVVKSIGDLARRPGTAGPPSYADTENVADDAALIGTPEEIVEKLRLLAARGIDYVLLSNASPTRKTLEVFAKEILPHVGHVPARAAAVAAAAAG